MRKIFKILLVAILSLFLSISAVGCQFINPNYTPNNSGSLMNSQMASLNVHFEKNEDEGQDPYTLAEAYEKVFRTSVAIDITNASGSGSGSGVIVDIKNSGNYVYIITCHHVISSGGEISVYVPDQEGKYDNEDFIFKGYIGNQIYSNNAVTLVGGDNVSDIAVIKINLDKPAVSGKKLSMEKIQKAKVISSNHSVRVLDTIFAIGNPLGELPGSATAGEISYLEREVVVGEVGLMRLMQISVLTNPGNSGGGLYNLYGELIGITNAGNTSYDGINFAIPATMEKRNNEDEDNGFISIASQLIATATETNYGYVSGRWNIGISVDSYSYRGISYVIVTDVGEGTNAALAGVEVDSLIESISFDGQTYTVTPSNFPSYVGQMRTTLGLGDSFTLYVMKRSIVGTTTHAEVSVTIAVADYIFCDTGM